MVLVKHDEDADDLKHVYLEVAQGDEDTDTSSAVGILVAPETDAIAACRVLTALFRADNVQYIIKPVSGFREMLLATQAIVGADEFDQRVHHIVHLGCGSSYDLEAEIPVPAGVTRIVIDSHMPVHHNNVHSNNIIVVHDTDLLASDVPTDADLAAIDAGGYGDEMDDAYASSYDSLDDDDDSDTDSGRGKGPARRKRRRDSGSARPHMPSVGYEYYDQGNFYSTPVAKLLYDLATLLSQDNNESLWLAIVGITSQFLQNHINHLKYSQLVARLELEVAAKNTNAHALGDMDKDGVALPADDKGTIAQSSEYRFMLYRHWTLYDSMYYSNYVATKLGVWKQRGRDVLNRFITRMGIPVKETMQKFAAMSRSAVLTLKANLDREAAAFDLPEIEYNSFEFRTGYSQPVCAADVAYAVEALLECASLKAAVSSAAAAGTPSGGSSGSGAGGGAGGGAGAGAGGNGGGGGISGGDSSGAGFAWEDNFTVAYNALSFKRQDLLMRGVHLAMDLQRAVVQHGTALLAKNVVTNVSHFRYVTVTNLVGVDAHIFTQPMALARLGRFLVDAKRAQGKWQGVHAKPLLVCALNERRQTYLVCGVNCAPQHGDLGRSGFRRVFALAGQHNKRTQLSYRMDWFDTSVVEVSRHDLPAFTMNLHAFLVKDAEENGGPRKGFMGLRDEEEVADDGLGDFGEFGVDDDDDDDDLGGARGGGGGGAAADGASRGVSGADSDIKRPKKRARRKMVVAGDSDAGSVVSESSSDAASVASGVVGGEATYSSGSEAEEDAGAGRLDVGDDDAGETQDTDDDADDIGGAGDDDDDDSQQQQAQQQAQQQRQQERKGRKRRRGRGSASSSLFDSEAAEVDDSAARESGGEEELQDPEEEGEEEGESVADSEADEEEEADDAGDDLDGFIVDDDHVDTDESDESDDDGDGV